MNRAQLLLQAKQRHNELHRPMVSKMIRGIDPQNDTLTLDGPEGMTKPIPVKHPFLNLDSWIRSMPSRGAGVRVLQQQSEDHDLINDYYYPNRNKLVEKYRKYEGVYRPLYPGEHEISSSGLAQTYWSANGRWEARGGIINMWLDNQALEAVTHSPTHIRKLHGNFETVVGDEERFGVVKRPETSIKAKYIKVGGKWAKEYLRYFYDGDGAPLIDHREGNVIDDDGNEVSGNFGNNLRLLKNIHTIGGDKTTIEIDEKGNWSVLLPTEATDGGFMEIPAGNLELNIQGDLLITAAGNTLKMTQGEIELKVGQVGPTLKMNNQGLTINGHNVVYHEFLDYFGQTHLTSTGIGYASWPTTHNPATIAAFNTQKNIPGIFKSNSSVR